MAEERVISAQGRLRSVNTGTMVASFLLVLVAAGPFIYPLRPQQASRYALTMAIAEDSSVVIDPYAHLLDKDRAVKDGHTYSDKAPGQPIFGVPVLIAGRALGIERAHESKQERSLDLWWVTFWSATAFGAGVLVLMQRRVSQVVGEFWTVAPIALFFGSMLLPFSGLLFGHVMAAFLLYASYVVLQNGSGRGQVFAAGLMAGGAVMVEYTAALAVVVLSALILMRSYKRAGWWLVGGALMAIPLGLYNDLAFGNPFRFSYQYTAFEGVVDSARPLLHMFSAATIENVGELFFSGRGLVVATPIMVCALAAGIARIKEHDSDAIIGVAMFCAFLLIPVLWENPWGGSAPGSRYLTPAIPFLAVPLAWSWKCWPRLTRFAAALSVLTMVAALVVQAMPYPDSPAGLGVWLGMLVEGITADTLWTMALGPWGWIPHGATVLSGLVAVWALSRSDETQLPEPARSATEGVMADVDAPLQLGSSAW